MKNEPTFMSLESFAKMARKILETDRDFVIGVSGFEGEGKSAFSMNATREINGCLDLQKHVLYAPRNIRKTIHTLNRLAFIADEGMESFYKRDWNTAGRKTMNTLFSMCRKQNLCMFLNMPNFWDFDQYYRDHRIKLWVFIPTRGHAILFGPDRNPFTLDRWYRKENLKETSKKLKKVWVSDEYLISVLRCSKNYVAEILFDDIDPEIRTEYITHKNANFDEYEKRAQEVDNRDKNRERLLNTTVKLYQDLALDQKEIGEIVGFSQGHVSRILKERGIVVR